MDLAAVQAEIATQLATISGLRTFGYRPDDVQPPAAIMVAPDTVTFDATYGRGSDEMALPMVLLVCRVDDRASWKEIAAYCNGTGPKSIKQVVEAGAYTTFDRVRVTDVTFDSVTLAATDYIAAVFNLDLEGSGTA